MATLQEVPDISKLMEVSNGNKAFVHKMISGYLDQSEKLILNIRRYLKRGDYDYLHYETHRLLGASRFLKITNVTKTIEELEKCFRNQEICEKIDILANQLKKQLQINKYQLDDIVDELSK